jgi:hypothetical protein
MGTMRIFDVVCNTFSIIVISGSGNYIKKWIFKSCTYYFIRVVV